MLTPLWDGMPAQVTTVELGRTWVWGRTTGDWPYECADKDKHPKAVIYRSMSPNQDAWTHSESEAFKTRDKSLDRDVVDWREFRLRDDDKRRMMRQFTNADPDDRGILNNREGYFIIRDPALADLLTRHISWAPEQGEIAIHDGAFWVRFSPGSGNWLVRA